MGTSTAHRGTRTNVVNYQSDRVPTSGPVVHTYESRNSRPSKGYPTTRTAQTDRDSIYNQVEGQNDWGNRNQYQSSRQREGLGQPSRGSALPMGRLAKAAVPQWSCRFQYSIKDYDPVPNR